MPPRTDLDRKATLLVGLQNLIRSITRPARHYRGWHATGGSSRHPPRTIVAD